MLWGLNRAERLPCFNWSGFQVELDQLRISRNLSPNSAIMDVLESATAEGPRKARTGVGTDLRRWEAAGAGIQLGRAAAASRWETPVREELWLSASEVSSPGGEVGGRGHLQGRGGDHGDGRGATGLPRLTRRHTRWRHQMAVSNHLPLRQIPQKKTFFSCTKLKLIKIF